jgi:phosphoribosylaminoimidazole carboxylase (NCAIR synthetase)
MIDGRHYSKLSNICYQLVTPTSVKAKTNHGRTALHTASRYSHLEIVQWVRWIRYRVVTVLVVYQKCLVRKLDGCFLLHEMAPRPHNIRHCTQRCVVRIAI